MNHSFLYKRLAFPQETGKREKIAFDRRRELPELVDFMNEECGSKVEVPKNFKPQAVRVFSFQAQ